MGQTDIELGYIGALVGQAHGETTLEAVTRVLQQRKRFAIRLAEEQACRELGVTTGAAQFCSVCKRTFYEAERDHRCAPLALDEATRETLDGLAVMQDTLGDEGRDGLAATARRAEALILSLIPAPHPHSYVPNCPKCDQPRHTVNRAIVCITRGCSYTQVDLPDAVRELEKMRAAIAAFLTSWDTMAPFATRDAPLVAALRQAIASDSAT